MTHTPASGPRAPVTTPPMSSASIAGGAILDVCWPAASASVAARPTPASTSSFDRIGHLLSLRVGPSSLRARREAYNDRPIRVAWRRPARAPAYHEGTKTHEEHEARSESDLFVAFVCPSCLRDESLPLIEASTTCPLPC